MLKVSFWVKGSREKNTEVLDYSRLLALVSDAQSIYTYSVGEYLDELKERKEDDPEEDGFDYLIDDLEKRNPNTKICVIDRGDGYPVYFVVPNFEGKEIKGYLYDELDNREYIYIEDDATSEFCKALLSSKAFWDWVDFHNIIINGKHIDAVDNGVEILR